MSESFIETVYADGDAGQLVVIVPTIKEIHQVKEEPFCIEFETGGIDSIVLGDYRHLGLESRMINVASMNNGEKRLYIALEDLDWEMAEKKPATKKWSARGQFPSPSGDAETWMMVTDLHGPGQPSIRVMMLVADDPVTAGKISSEILWITKGAESQN